MSDDNYTEAQARLDVNDFAAKNPNASKLDICELRTAIQLFQHEYKFSTRITSFHVYVFERYDTCMVGCDAQRWNNTNRAYVISL